jgi:DNA repair exonuclease SbcCD ATPase subunit
MADETPSKFKFNVEDPEPDNFYHEELKDLRVEKLSQRVTLLSILLPCLLGVAIYFGYRDLAGRVNQGQNSGSLEIQKISKEIEDLSKNFNEKLITFSTTLSSQDKDFGTSIEGRLTAIEKKVDTSQKSFKSLDDSLKQMTDTIERLNVSKADQKSQVIAFEKVNADIDSLKNELQESKTIQRDLKAMSADIKKLESQLTQKLAALSADMEQTGKKYTELQAAVDKLAGQTVDQDTLALEVFKLKKNFQNQITKEISDFNQRLDALQKEIVGIPKMSGSQSPSSGKLSQQSLPRHPTANENVGSVEPAQPSDSERILEKNLIE